jgi:leucyl-tRNA synthetase
MADQQALQAWQNQVWRALHHLSPKDGQPCMDHDRQDGEGVKPLQYTCIKVEVVNWSPAAKESIESKMCGRKVFMVTATLQPETM